MTLAVANLYAPVSTSGTSSAKFPSSVVLGIWLLVVTTNGATKMHRIALSVGVLHSLNQPLVTTARLAGRTV